MVPRFDCRIVPRTTPTVSWLAFSFQRLLGLSEHQVIELRQTDAKAARYPAEE